jgi:hypothetical protein
MRRGEVMARVSPSQVVALIDRMVPGIETHDSAKIQALRIRLALLVEMVENVPPELMPADAQRYTEVISSIALIRSELKARYARGGGSAVDFDGMLGDLHPFCLIRRGFAGVPDDLPSAETPMLSFIADPAAKTSLRLDTSWASSALRNREWKSSHRACWVRDRGAATLGASGAPVRQGAESSERAARQMASARLHQRGSAAWVCERGYDHGSAARAELPELDPSRSCTSAWRSL